MLPDARSSLFNLRFVLHPVMKVRQVLSSSIFTLLLACAADAQTTSFQSGTTWETGTWSAGIPAANSNAIIGLPGAAVTFDATAAPALNSLTIDAANTAAQLLHGANNLTAATVTVGDVALGRYEQSGGLLTADTLILGNTGTGVYVQTGGSLIVNGNSPLSHLIIGAGDGGVGRFELSGTGSVTASAIHVGGGLTSTNAVSSGTFIQDGGTVTVTNGSGEIVVGGTSGTSGKYEMKGGSLTSKQLYIGLKGENPAEGDRSFVHTGGNVTITDNLILGGYYEGTATPAGSYTLTGDTDTSTLTTSKVWVGLSGSGTFTQDGGTHNITLGDEPFDRSLMIAGAQAGSEGVYNMKSGVLNADGIYIGLYDPAGDATGGKGTLNQSGGTINVSQQLIVDNGGTAASLGSYVMTGGTLNTTGSATYAGLLVLGTFDHIGGTVTANGTGAEAGLRIDGTYNFGGGTLQGTGEKVNYGTFSGFGTIAGSGKVINQGSMTFKDGESTISAPVENQAESTLTVNGNNAVFEGTVLNRGDFVATADANVVFEEKFTNTGGVYLSDGGNTDFSGGFENVAGAGNVFGYLTTDPLKPGDLFRMGGDFIVANANLSLWDTATAKLEFYQGEGSPDGVHSLIYAGLDHGDLTNGEGYLGFQDNMSWGEVFIASGSILETGTGDGHALYTEKLTFGSNDLAEIISQVSTFSGDLKIYYHPDQNPELEGQKIPFGSGTGFVAPVPEPSAALLAGVGAIALSFRRRRRA